MKIRVLISAVAALLAVVSAIKAENIYIAQSACGLDTGIDANNAHSMAWLNSWANWGDGANKVGAGDTVHLTGMLTSELGVQGSGTAGNPITIYFEPGAKFSVPALPHWHNFIAVNGNYVVIDGGTNGTIECTDNGTDMTYQNVNFAVRSDGKSHITVKNLNIINLYVRKQNSTDTHEGGYASYFNCGSDIYVTNCMATNLMNGFCYNYNDAQITSNITFSGCAVVKCNWGLSVSAGTGLTNPQVCNVLIEKCHIEGFEPWNGTGAAYGIFHHNGMYFYNEATAPGGCISDLVIRGNYVGSVLNPITEPPSTTGGISLSMYSQSRSKRVRIYNNFLMAKPNFYWGNGFIPAQLGMDVLVANNTMVGWSSNGVAHGGTIGGGGQDFYMLNNLFVGVGTLAVTANPIDSDANTLADNLAGFSRFWSDYNILPTAGQGNNFYLWRHHWYGKPNQFTWQASYTSLAAWQSLYPGHFDPHSTTAVPSVDANYVPLMTDTVARGKGTNLTAWGITEDFYGNPRPATGNWTIGAFENVSNAPKTATNAAISLDKFTVNYGSVTVGQYADQTVSVQNTGNAILNGSAGVSAPFSIVSGGSYNLNPGQSQTVTVRYSPTAATSDSRTVSFTGGQGVSLTVSGLGVSTPPPVSNLTVGVPYSAQGGSVSAPFLTENDYVYQTSETSLGNGGSATYDFAVSAPGDYAVMLTVDAPSDAANSLFVNIDAQPLDPYSIWDIPITSGFQRLVVGWRGNGTFDNNQFVPMRFPLAAGNHQLILRGREGNVKISAIRIQKFPVVVGPVTILPK